MKSFTFRLGEINHNTYGTKMKIIKYNCASDILVEFQDEFKVTVKTNYQAFKKKEVTNPYDKTKYGVGYLGLGKYKSKIEGKMSKCYNTWCKMMQRCYDEKYHEKEPTYKGCKVCEEWWNFQNFAEWYYEHYYEIEGQDIQLDKDILNKGNKVYSPDNCVFVPQRINNLFTKNDKRRGKLPIGVTRRKNRFISRCCILKELKNEWIWLGSFKTVDEAFHSYKMFKEKYIKEVADEYKYLIPKELYDAMYDYRVYLND